MYTLAIEQAPRTVRNLAGGLSTSAVKRHARSETSLAPGRFRPRPRRLECLQDGEDNLAACTRIANGGGGQMHLTRRGQCACVHLNANLPYRSMIRTMSRSFCELRHVHGGLASVGGDREKERMLPWNDRYGRESRDNDALRAGVNHVRESGLAHAQGRHDAAVARHPTWHRSST